MAGDATDETRVSRFGHDLPVPTMTDRQGWR
jgi:hypothetical protein